MRIPLVACIVTWREERNHFPCGIAPARCDRDKWPPSPFLGRHTLQGCKCNQAKMAELLLIHPCGDIWPFAFSPESLFKRDLRPQPRSRGPTPSLDLPALDHRRGDEGQVQGGGLRDAYCMAKKKAQSSSNCEQQ